MSCQSLIHHRSVSDSLCFDQEISLNFPLLRVSSFLYHGQGRQSNISTLPMYTKTFVTHINCSTAQVPELLGLASAKDHAW